MKGFKLFIIFMIFCYNLHGQQNESSNKEFALYDSSFNKGNIQNLYELIQGQVPGVIFSRPGADPSRPFEVRTRGINTLRGRSSPLIVINGIPGVPDDLIDPLSIRQMEFLRGYNTAEYGIQGASGILDINTTTPNGKDFIRYQTFYALEEKAYNQRPLSSQQYLALGGRDYGGNTDWMEEITKPGNALVQSLSFGNTISDLVDITGSINHRRVDGILNKTGFNRTNIVLGTGADLWKDKLSVAYQGIFNTLEGSIGTPAAFRSAMNLPPTLPVRFTGTGDFVQSYLFDQYNPVAITELLDARKENTGWFHSASMNLQLKDFSFDLKYGRSDSKTAYKTIIDQALYFEIADSSNYIIGDLRNFYSAAVSYRRTSDNINLESSISLDHQNITLSNFYSRRSLGSGLERQNISAFNMTGISVGLNIEFDDVMSIALMSRPERSTALGSNSQWGHFYHIGSSLNMASLINFKHQLYLTGGIGKSGLTPYDANLAREIVFQDPMGNPFVYRSSNPELTYERVRNMEIGLSFSSMNELLEASMVFYSNKADQLIGFEEIVFFEEPQLNFRNSNQIYNNGIELSIAYKKKISQKFNIRSSVVVTSLETRWEEQIYETATSAFPDPPCGCSTQLISHIENEAYGTFYGPVVSEIRDGQYHYEDIDSDGTANPYNDLQIIGKALPSWWLGWANTFKYGNLQLDFLLRGIFGHDLANLNRLSFQRPFFPNIPQNIVSGSPISAGPNLWSNIYVEDASFLRMHYVNLSYHTNLDLMQKSFSLELYLTGNNLFTITNYSGNDPEVRLGDRNDFDGNPYYMDDLSPGIDRTEQWLPSRSYVIGVVFGL